MERADAKCCCIFWGEKKEKKEIRKRWGHVIFISLSFSLTIDNDDDVDDDEEGGKGGLKGIFDIASALAAMAAAASVDGI